MMFDNKMKFHFVRLKEAELLRDMAFEYMVNGETKEYFAFQTEYATALKRRLQMETGDIKLFS